MLEIGLTHEAKRIIEEIDCIKFLGDEVKPSLATPRMIWWMEFAARDGVLPHLDPGQDTVGTLVNVRHIAATPLGKEVTFRAQVVALDGRKVTFEIEAWEDGEMVGQGTHERYIVDVERFAAGLKKRFGEA